MFPTSGVPLPSTCATNTKPTALTGRKPSCATRGTSWPVWISFCGAKVWHQGRHTDHAASSLGNTQQSGRLTGFKHSPREATGSRFAAAHAVTDLPQPFTESSTTPMSYLSPLHNDTTELLADLMEAAEFANMNGHAIDLAPIHNAIALVADDLYRATVTHAQQLMGERVHIVLDNPELDLIEEEPEEHQDAFHAMIEAHILSERADEEAGLDNVCCACRVKHFEAMRAGLA